VKSLLLGQLISVLNTFTGIFSSTLADAGINLPSTQSSLSHGFSNRWSGEFWVWKVIFTSSNPLVMATLITLIDFYIWKHQIWGTQFSGRTTYCHRLSSYVVTGMAMPCHARVPIGMPALSNVPKKRLALCESYRGNPFWENFILGRDHSALIHLNPCSSAWGTTSCLSCCFAGNFHASET